MAILASRAERSGELAAKYRLGQASERRSGRIPMLLGHVTPSVGDAVLSKLRRSKKQIHNDVPHNDQLNHIQQALDASPHAVREMTIEEVEPAGASTATDILQRPVPPELMPRTMAELT